VADRSVHPETLAGDPLHAAGDELYRAACAAMRLLQDRQAHVPEEMLDPGRPGSCGSSGRR
jgi:hypothetical protein